MERGAYAFDTFCEVLNTGNRLQVETTILRKLNMALEEGKMSYNGMVKILSHFSLVHPVDLVKFWFLYYSILMAAISGTV